MRILLLTTLFLMGCQPQNNLRNSTAQTTDTKQAVTARPDPYSFSRHDQVRVTHLSLDVRVNFKQHILQGHVVLDYEKVNAEATQLRLDTRDLKIKRVETVTSKKNHKLLWRTGQNDADLGAELIIDLPIQQAPIKIFYETMPEASGLQWLEPEQTSSQTQPFLFSQSQSIHARSWIPLQDSPSVRVTYDATIRVKRPVVPVMSADNNNQQAVDGVYTFTMQQAIPAYLIAIAVGDLQHRQISEHVTIYAEKEVLDAAAYEFAETENMITATEALYGPYRWGQYDLLVLPPSFPFGGMENPKLSHITPTIIAGDRSLDSLIAHELAHSWSGNLVTNALWNDAWLNEGFTSYIEARITAAIHGEQRMLMEATLIHQALLQAMEKLPVNQQKLVNPEQAADPDDYFSAVTYDKGRFFLEWIEQQVGRQAFDQFLIKYFDHFAFQSVHTQDFVNFLQQHLLPQHPEQLSMQQINTWLHEPGMPDFFRAPSTERFNRITQQVQAWSAGTTALDGINTEQWTTHEWLHFLRNLPENMSQRQLSALDQAFAFTERQNSEIAHDWLLISIRHQYQAAYARLIDYLSSIGRVKLIKPLYEALMTQPELHYLAHNIYQKARPGYHNIARVQMDQIVGYKDPKTE